jgi:hypothetical protein
MNGAPSTRALIHLSPNVQTELDVVELVSDLLNAMQSKAQPETSVSVVVTPTGVQPALEAAVRAVCGFVQSAALDSAARGGRCSLVIADELTADVEASIELINGDSGSIALGMTVDLRSR